MKNVNTQKKKACKLSSKGVKRLVLLGVCALLLVATLLGILVSVNAYRNSGASIRKVVVLQSENFTLTLPMYTYYLRSMETGADKDLVAMALAEQGRFIT